MLNQLKSYIGAVASNLYTIGQFLRTLCQAPINTHGPDMQQGSVVYFFTLVKQPSTPDSRAPRKMVFSSLLSCHFATVHIALLYICAAQNGIMIFSKLQ